MKKELEIIDVNRQNTLAKRELSPQERRKRQRRQRARQLAIKRRRRRRKILRFVMAGVLVAVLCVAVSRIELPVSLKSMFAGSDSTSVISDSGKDSKRLQDFLYEVKFEEFFKENKPQTLSDAEVYQRLKVLAEEYPELEEIYEDCEVYPVKLLASLCNNPELHEYVKGYKAYADGDTSVAGKAELTAKEKKQKFPLFLQWDKRWGYEEYGDFNIALSGCGPTTLAMAATALTDDNTITPDKVAQYSMNNGYYVEGTGTAWSLMTDGCENFGIKSEEVSLDEYVMKNQLDAGKVIICSMREGDFTAVGHFIMIYGYDENGFLVNDANCIYRSSRAWTYEELKNQIRILWAFEKK